MAIPWNKSVASNKFASYGLFYNRELYKTQTYPEQVYDVQPIDLWYVSQDYGKVDALGNPIAVIPSFLSQVPSTNNEELFVMNFVADAFADLRNYMGQAGFQNKIETEDTEYYDLQPHRGWTSLDIEFDNYMQIAYDAFFEGFMADKAIDNKVTNFASFLKVFSGFISRITPKFVFTKTAFISSRYGTPLGCGLMLDLAVEQNDDDAVKYDKFIQDKNFTFFTKAAQQFGFLLDKNAPWRIVADLGSVAMQNYMRNYGLTLNNVFRVAYAPTYKTDIETLKGYLVEFYNAYASNRPEVRVVKDSSNRQNALSTTIHKRILVDVVSPIEFNDLYWLKYYLFIRGKEMNRPWRQVTFDRLFRTASQLYKFQNYSKALAYINRRVRNKEFKFLPLTNSESAGKINFDFLNTVTTQLFRLF